MSLAELFLIAAGLSMDAFAVAVCAGLTIRFDGVKKAAAVVGLYFGLFQAAMPLLGYAAAWRFSDKIAVFDHWLAFGLLCFIGGKMLMESFGNKDDYPGESDFSLGPLKMLPLAVATSIDAMAVGASFAFLRVNIWRAAAVIGATTFLLSMAGVKTGNVFGAKFKSKAELAGGAILIGMGFKILIKHTGMFL